MSLSEFRKTVKLKGQKSRLFTFKTEIFEAIAMGMSLAHMVDFLSLHGIKISRQALQRWISNQETYQRKPHVVLSPSIQKSEPNQPNTTVTQNVVVNQPKVEPTHSKVDDRASKVREKMGAATDGIPDGLLEIFSHTILKN